MPHAARAGIRGHSTAPRTAPSCAHVLFEGAMVSSSTITNAMPTGVARGDFYVPVRGGGFGRRRPGEDLVHNVHGCAAAAGAPKKGVSFRAAARTLLNVKNFPLTRSMISTWRTRTPSGGGAYSTRSISTAARVRAPADDARGAGGTMRSRFCVPNSYKDSPQSGFLISTKVITQKTLMGTLSLKTHGAQAAITLGCTSCFGFNRTFGMLM